MVAGESVPLTEQINSRDRASLTPIIDNQPNMLPPSNTTSPAPNNNNTNQVCITIYEQVSYVWLVLLGTRIFDWIVLKSPKVFNGFFLPAVKLLKLNKCFKFWKNFSIHTDIALNCLNTCGCLSFLQSTVYVNNWWFVYTLPHSAT